MPQAQQADPSIVDELRKRGLLATGGNIRLMPFDAAQGDPASSANSPASGPSGITPNQDGTVTATDLNGQQVVIDPKQIDPNNVPNLSDDQWDWLLPMLSGAAGAAIGQMLATKRGARPSAAPVDPLAPLPPSVAGAANAGDGIVEGEFTEVAPNKAIAAGTQQALPAPDPRLPQPPNQIEAQATPPNYSTATEIAKRKALARQANGVPVEPSGAPVQLADEFTDFSPEELTEARTIAKALVEQRSKGNARALKGGKGVGRDKLPTSRGRLTESVDEMMGHVARTLRDQKALRALQRAVP